MEPSFETVIDMNTDLISRLREFMENEARSCSMDFGCVTPEYVYKMWEGTSNKWGLMAVIKRCF